LCSMVVLVSEGLNHLTLLASTVLSKMSYLLVIYWC